MIPLVDIVAQDKKIQSLIKHAINKVIQKGDFILGDEVKHFENEFAKYCNVKYAVGVASGSDAILLALRALKIKKGDEIIVPANTFISTVLPIIYLGAKPILVDINPNTYNIDVSKIEKAITDKTKVILPVHLFGQVAEMDRIMKIAKKHKLSVVEDACQAHGSVFNKKKAGSFGDVSCFSFYPGKNLGAYGDGGMITTNKKRVADRVRLLRNIGQKQKNVHTEKGYNSRLDTLQAAILRIKLSYLNSWNKERRKLAIYFSKKLRGLPIAIPQEEKRSISNYHLYVIRAKKRDKLLYYLHKKKIFAGINYPVPIHLHKALSDLAYKRGDFPIAERYAKEILSLPIFPGLTKKQADKISLEIRNFYAAYR